MPKILTDLRLQLEEAYGVAEAADACARIGQTSRGVEIANSADDLIGTAERLLARAAPLARPSPGAAGTDPNSAGGSEEGPTSVLESDLRGQQPIDPVAAADIIRLLLHQAANRLQRAVGIARAAELPAATNSLSVGTQLALQVEPVLYDVKHLINTASIFNRMVSEDRRPGQD